MPLCAICRPNLFLAKLPVTALSALLTAYSPPSSQLSSILSPTPALSMNVDSSLTALGSGSVLTLSSAQLATKLLP